MVKNGQSFYSAALKHEMNSNRPVLGARIHPPFLKIGSCLDNSLNISQRFRKPAATTLLSPSYSKFFVNHSIDALFNLFNLFSVFRGRLEENNRSPVKIDARQPVSRMYWTTIVLIHHVFPRFLFFFFLPS